MLYNPTHKWGIPWGYKSPTDPITFDPKSNGVRKIIGSVNREPYDGLRFITIPYQNQNLETGQ